MARNGTAEIVRVKSYKRSGTDFLVGEYLARLISGHRIVIPNRIRTELGTEFYISKGYEGSLILVSQVKWLELVKPLTSGSFFRADVRDTLRFLAGSAFKLEADSQGRIIIPPALREYSGIKFVPSQRREVVLTGLINYVEIWEKQRWEKKQSELEKNAGAIAEKVLSNLNLPQQDQPI